MTEQIVAGNGAGTMTNERRALIAVDAILKQSPLTPEQQAAVALNASVMAVARTEGAVKSRGSLINAMTKEYRERLQKYLPR